MSRNEKNNSGSTGSGIGIGAVIAVCCSWSVNHSVGYAILHAICSWFYVIYYLIAY
jgi:hypothetical protein